eukprot:tig00000383_g24665.t1
MPPKKGKGSKSNTPVAGLPSKIASLVLDGPPVKKVLDNVTCTGTLRKNIPYCDIIIDNFSVNFYGKELVKDTTLELSAGRRYGLLGANGSGKTVMLAALGQREVDIPRHFDIFHLHQEEEASDKTAIEAVCSSEETRLQLEKEAEEISRDITDDTPDEVHEYLHWIYERLEEYDSETARARAAKILHGLGFSPAMQEKKTRDFSGGWRMRISLAKGLFLRPTLMLLDEPTNHLDIEAVVWLEQYLSNWNPRGILLLISHSQDFLNNVCTNIIHLHKRRLTVYGGNYDTYVETREQLEENQNKMYKWQQDQIKHMREYIARFGHGSRKLARQAQSKEKVLAKMERNGLVEKVTGDSTLKMSFIDPEPLSPPVLVLQNISFGYPGQPLLYEDIDLGVDLDSRIALVGPNGAGKSTLMKLMVEELSPTHGMVRRHTKLRLGRFHQHFVDQMDMSLSPLQYMRSCFPEEAEEKCRGWLGKFDVTGAVQTQPMRTLSDGQCSRVVFAWLAYKQPHILLLDEPTNHLDMESIDSLAIAINAFEGGVVLVSHDMRLISAVAEEIWVCDNKKVERFKGDLNDYKNLLINKMKKDNMF